jgi:hypothetical protein
MTNFMLLMVLWCLNKSFFAIALVFIIIKLIIKNIDFNW